MIARLLHILQGHCRHPRYSWPQRTKEGGHYVVCLTCGKELAYSWEEMKVLEAVA